MEIIVTRSMTVADGGVTRQFAPKKDKDGKDVVQNASADVAHRLFRANAAFKASLRDGQVTKDASKDPNAGNVNVDPNSPTGPLTTTGTNGIDPVIPGDDKPKLPENFDGMTKAELIEFAGKLTPPVELASADTKDEVKAKIRERFPA